MDKEKALKIWLPVIADGVKDLPECKESLEMAIEALKDQKTGHWKHTTHYARPYRVCSVCGCERIDDHSTGWNYCPNCGAKMKGENNEG